MPATPAVTKIMTDRTWPWEVLPPAPGSQPEARKKYLSPTITVHQSDRCDQGAEAERGHQACTASAPLPLSCIAVVCVHPISIISTPYSICLVQFLSSSRMNN
jgi:hypothetical protein